MRYPTSLMLPHTLVERETSTLPRLQGGDGLLVVAVYDRSWNHDSRSERNGTHQRHRLHHPCYQGL
jgi:hypothetical protein